jgi:hypothetical protein
MNFNKRLSAQATQGSASITPSGSSSQASSPARAASEGSGSSASCDPLRTRFVDNARSMTKHKVAELEGALLDAVVAMALGDGYGWNEHHAFTTYKNGSQKDAFSPSSRWDDGGPIIERERIEVSAVDRDQVYGPTTWNGFADGVGGFMASGPTPLIAAMRAYVASKFGDEVDLPC